MNSKPTSLWEYLDKHQIVIPIIQRDYAQGRKGKSELRKRFLESLKQALTQALTQASTNEQPLRLDFVYGDSCGDDVHPIDGQQRLTTLWLLHWYIAMRAECLDEATSRLKRFSYETRTSSRDFCEQLINWTPSRSDERTLKGQIEDQTWFRAEWKQDPTIDAMLRMLSGEAGEENDCIEKVFNDDSTTQYKPLWQCMKRNIFQFYALDMGEMKNVDDLYIKMNARGKQLTSFENFKAELVNYIRDKANQEQGENQNNDELQQWEALDNAQDGFCQKLDNAWTDIFWKLRSKDNSGIPEYQNRIDEIFFAFFNRFFLNYQALALGMNSSDWNKFHLYGQGNDETLDFSSLDHYSIPLGSKEIPLGVLRDLSAVLDRWSALANALNGSPQLGPSWDQDAFFLLPTYETKEKKLSLILDNSGNNILKIVHITVKQRAVFFAICQWLIKNPPQDNNSSSYTPEQKQHFCDWLRVIWNIVENSTENLPGLLVFINTILLPGNRDILEYLRSLHFESDKEKYVIRNNTKSFETKFETAVIQLKEECEKALKMSDNDWQRRITAAENFAFFRGAIRFLFHDENGNLCWDNFIKKYRNTQLYFGDDLAKNNTFLLRAFVAKVKQWETLCNILFDSKTETWRNNILLKDGLQAPVHNFLMDDAILRQDLNNFTSDMRIPEQKLIQEQLVTTSILTQTYDKYIIQNGLCFWLHSYHAMHCKDIALGSRRALFSKLFPPDRLGNAYSEMICGDAYFCWEGHNFYCDYNNRISLCDEKFIPIVSDTINNFDKESFIRQLQQLIERY